MRVMIEALRAFSGKVDSDFPQKMRLTKDAGARQNRIVVALSLAFLIAAAGAANAQDKGTLTPKPLPPLANPDDPKTPAKELFGRRPTPAPISAVTHMPVPAAAVSAAANIAARIMGKPSLASADAKPESRTIGFYAKGCLAGGVALNCSVNARLLEAGWSDVYVHPAATDDGAAVGLALYGWIETLGNSRQPVRLFSPFLGRSYNLDETSAAAHPEPAATRVKPLFDVVTPDVATAVAQLRAAPGA